MNESLHRLAAGHAERITASGNLAKSKLAWKIATHRQAMLYRVVALGSATALCWNQKNFLSGFVTARSLVETVALLLDFENQIERHLKQENLAAIDKLTMNRTFGSRDADWIKAHPDAEAVNVLTIIKKLDKRADFKGMLSHYEGLCEFAHPNLQGHRGSFATLDTSTGTETYSEDKLQGKTAKLFGGVLLVTLAEHSFERIAAMIDEIADLQHRIHPVGGRKK